MSLSIHVVYTRVQVRSGGSSKGRFVDVVLSKLGWRRWDDGRQGTGEGSPASDRKLCICIGDDVSDEEMFLAVKVSRRSTPCVVGLGGWGDRWRSGRFRP